MAALIYNVTTKIEHDIHAQWLQWMREKHIPAMLATGCFTKAVILKLKGVDGTDGPTYAVQYFADEEHTYERYLAEFAHALQAEVLKVWGDRMASFSTVLEVVN